MLKRLEVILDVDSNFDLWGMDRLNDEDVVIHHIEREKLPSDKVIRSGGNGFLYKLGKLCNVKEFDFKVLKHDGEYSANPVYRYRKLGKKSTKVVEELKNEASIFFSPNTSQSCN